VEIGFGSTMRRAPIASYVTPNALYKTPAHPVQAEGRDSDMMASNAFRISREVYVPQFENGFLQYTIMEIIAASDADSGWAVKDLPAQPFPNVSGPSAMISITAMDGVDTQRISKNGFQVPADRESWTGNSVNME
jgi:hypothetical protein